MKNVATIQSVLFKRNIISALMLCAFTALNCSQAQAISYNFTDLGFGFQARALNDIGQIVGNENNKATLWQNGTKTTLSNTNSITTDINNAGQVLVNNFVSSTQTTASIWQNGITTSLGTLGGTSAFAYSINDAGVTVGRSGAGFSSTNNAVVWNNGLITNLNTFTGIGARTPLSLNEFAINDNNTVVGSSTNNTAGIIFQATVYDNNQYQALAPVDSIKNLANTSFAYGVNNNELVVGISRYTSPIGNFERFATVWDNGIGKNLGVLGTGDNSAALAINESNMIVGFSNNVDNGNNTLATIWQNDVLYDLNSLVDTSILGWRLENAYDINELGWIIGNAIDTINNQRHGYLLKPNEPVAQVPVPAAAWLFASGLGVFGVAKRRKLKQLS